MGAYEVDVQLSFCAADGLYDEDTVKKITQRFTFQYTDKTTIDELFDRVQELCGPSPFINNEIWPFKLYLNGYRFNRNGWVPLRNYVKSFCPNNLVELNFIDGIGGTVDEINGIRYFFHSDEKCAHSPHIHATYQGENVSIDLQSFQIKGKFKNPKKQKEALRFAKQNCRRLKDRYVAETNGISIGSFSSMEKEPGCVIDKLSFEHKTVKHGRYRNATKSKS